MIILPRFRVEELYKRKLQIPKGRVLTYGAPPNDLKAPSVSRVVGQILKANLVPIIVQCHMVLKSDGRVGRYSGAFRFSKKMKLVSSKGQAIYQGEIRSLSRVIFTEFSTITVHPSRTMSRQSFPDRRASNHRRTARPQDR